MPKPAMKTTAPTAAATGCPTCCLPRRRGTFREMDELARLLSRMGYDFVSLGASGAVEIVAAWWVGTRRFTIGLVLQPLLQQFTTLLAYGFGELGLDALIIVAPDPASLESLAPLLCDQVPAEWTGKVGVVTAGALQLLFPENP